jgi:hypothetical protein
MFDDAMTVVGPSIRRLRRFPSFSHDDADYVHCEATEGARRSSEHDKE